MTKINSVKDLKNGDAIIIHKKQKYEVVYV